MFNTQQAPPGGEFYGRAPDDLFPASGSGRQPARAAAMPRSAPAGSPLVSITGDVTMWYRARRVWFAAFLLFAAVAFRLAAAPDPVSLQSAEIPDQTATTAQP